MGHVTGPLSRVLDVPVVLTLFSVLNYVILIWAFRKTREEARVGDDLLWKDAVVDNVMDVMDLGNMPLFSALFEQIMCCVPVDHMGKKHGIRHLRLVAVGSAHVWIKTSLLAMTWSRATHLERFNIVVPLLLTMGSKSYSTLQVETVVIKEIKMFYEESFYCPFFILFPFMAIFAFPGLVVLACAARLAGIAFCPCHYLNLISGCVPCVC